MLKYLPSWLFKSGQFPAYCIFFKNYSWKKVTRKNTTTPSSQQTTSFEFSWKGFKIGGTVRIRGRPQVHRDKLRAQNRLKHNGIARIFWINSKKFIKIRNFWFHLNFSVKGVIKIYCIVLFKLRQSTKFRNRNHY